MGTFQCWKEWSGIFQIPGVPDLFCTDNVNVYICLSDNREAGEMVGFLSWDWGAAVRWGFLKWQRLGIIVWRRWMPWLEVYCHSLEQEIILGLRCGTEERKSASQGTEGIYFRDFKDWSNSFHMTFPSLSHAHDCMQQSFLLMEMWSLYFLSHCHLLVSLLVHTVSYTLWHHIIKIDDYADVNGSLRKLSTWTLHHRQLLNDYTAIKKFLLFKLKTPFFLLF